MKPTVTKLLAASQPSNGFSGIRNVFLPKNVGYKERWLQCLGPVYICVGRAAKICHVEQRRMKGGAASLQEEVCKEGLDSKLKAGVRQGGFVVFTSVAQKKYSKNRVFVANVSMVRA